MKLNKRTLFIILAIFLSLILLYLLIFFGTLIYQHGNLSSTNDKNDANKLVQTNQTGNANLQKTGFELNKEYSSIFSPNFGNKNAKIGVVVFLDFDCPFCLSEYPSLEYAMKKYSDKGYFEFREFPVESVHPNARNLANIALCANEQDKFFEMFDILFLNSIGRSGADNLDNFYASYATQANLNVEKFNECINNKKYDKIINKDIVDGLNSNVKGTPTFFINGRKVEGVLKKEDWDNIFKY
jgi:protein-disulfide isomerase